MPWWIDCFCSPSPPSFQTRPDQTSGHGGGDLSRSSSFRPSVETGDSPYFESDEVKPSKRLGAPVGAPLRGAPGAPPDLNLGWETGNLSTLEFARSKRMESKRSNKPPATQLNSIPEFIAEAKMPNGWAAEAAASRQAHNR
ncbi:hypothetical protein ENH_00000960 [Eimeria necatrix]|uniref:Uncharacterized protein n=1 Tax=Eimeria necatrix TaxID=51315 RepID=U6MMA2_9EIME|nr:hypothetical protein ENH_00000960 [Eimeria necatrix]CDJ65141.1 hypothetical protein ENH_00000960 [Eimeria necatrix]